MKFAITISSVLMVILITEDVYGRPRQNDRTDFVGENPIGDLYVPKTSNEHLNEKIGRVEEVPASPIKSRQKRLSDQRRAELETLVALARIGTGKFANSYRASRQLSGRHTRSIVGGIIPNPQIVLRHKGVSIKEGGAAYPLIS